MRWSEPDTIAGWQPASFLVGWLLICVAVLPPLAGLDHELLTAHMVQHLLLMTLAPPLLWLGEPLRILLQGLPRFPGSIVISLPSYWAIRWFRRVFRRPGFCWLGAAVALVAWHIPALFMLGMRSELWHGVEQASFLITGLLFWWPVVRSLNTPSSFSGWLMLLYLFFATLPCDILSGFLVFCDRVVYSVYFTSSNSFGLSALEDQQCAGALMWTCVTVAYLIAGALLTARLLSPQRA